MKIVMQNLENLNYNIFCKNATRKIFFQVKSIALYILINSQWWGI